MRHSLPILYASKVAASDPVADGLLLDLEAGGDVFDGQELGVDGVFIGRHRLLSLTLPQ